MFRHNTHTHTRTLLQRVAISTTPHQQHTHHCDACLFCRDTNAMQQHRACYPRKIGTSVRFGFSFRTHHMYGLYIDQLQRCNNSTMHSINSRARKPQRFRLMIGLIEAAAKTAIGIVTLNCHAVKRLDGARICTHTHTQMHACTRICWLNESDRRRRRSCHPPLADWLVVPRNTRSAFRLQHVSLLAICERSNDAATSRGHTHTHTHTYAHMHIYISARTYEIQPQQKKRSFVHARIINDDHYEFYWHTFGFSVAAFFACVTWHM